MKRLKAILLAGMMLMMASAVVYGDDTPSVRLVTDRSLELTGFQDSRGYSPECDFRNDFAMVYGADNPKLPDYIQSWVDKDYVPQMMTGIAWGRYADFKDLNGDGVMALIQVEANGREKGHGHLTPYIVPSVQFADYMSEKMKPIIDAGVVAIHLEEPEFWAYTGFSKAFEKEWKLYYDEPFVRPDESPDAQYKASRLKYYLYSRALRRVAEASKEYALQKYGRKLRMYVPTHSLVNYSHWSIVSPQSSLIDSDVIDGCIAQVWTGTSRTENVYEGKAAERTFETAFLEYGVMQELVRNTNRRMWFLNDPIEDNARHDWDDYRYNYKATLIASLLHPKVWHYEICPWPHRVMTGKYPQNSPNATRIPADYATILCTVFNQFRDMEQKDVSWQNETHGIGVLIADSAMFQRSEPSYRLAAPNGKDPKFAEGHDIRHFSAFYGMSLPLVKHGIPVQPVQLDNTIRFANYLKDYKVLVLSYEYMKPQVPAINQAVAGWVSNGGTLVYVGADTDPFNTVTHWWNSGDSTYKTAAEHLFETMGISRTPETGEYSYGKGHVFVERVHPAYYTRSKKAAGEYLATIRKAAKTAGLDYVEHNYLCLNRGPYVIAACLEESISKDNLVLEGLYVDIFDAKLSVLDKVTVKPGQRAWLMDLNKLEDGKAEPIASAGRIETWTQDGNTVEYEMTATKGVNIVSRIRLPKKPATMVVDGKDFGDYVWDAKSKTIFYTSPTIDQKQIVKISW